MLPVENHMPSKTDDFDESGITDRGEYSFILPAMADLNATRRDAELLVHGPTLQSVFRRATIEAAMAQLRDSEGIRGIGQRKSKTLGRRYR